MVFLIRQTTSIPIYVNLMTFSTLERRVMRNSSSELEVLDLENPIRDLEKFFQNFETRASVSSYSSTF